MWFSEWMRGAADALGVIRIKQMELCGCTRLFFSSFLRVCVEEKLYEIFLFRKEGRHMLLAFR